MNIKRLLIATAAACAALCASAANADNCELLWDQPCCEVPGAQFGISLNTLIICNCTDVESEYEWFLKTAQPGVTFDPPFGLVTLPPGECIEIPIKVYCPPPGAAGAISFVFQANVLNLTTGNQFSCQGSVRDTGDIKIMTPDPVVPVPVDGTATANLVVSNIGSSGKDGVADISVVVMGEGSAVPMWQNPVRVAPTEMVQLQLMISGPEAGRRGVPTADTFFDIIIEYDVDGDGTPDPVSALKARVGPGPCVGDLDGDGSVGSSDLAELIGRWGPCP